MTRARLVRRVSWRAFPSGERHVSEARAPLSCHTVSWSWSNVRYLPCPDRVRRPAPEAAQPEPSACCGPRRRGRNLAGGELSLLSDWLVSRWPFGTTVDVWTSSGSRSAIDRLVFARPDQLEASSISDVRYRWSWSSYDPPAVASIKQEPFVYSSRVDQHGSCIEWLGLNWSEPQQQSPPDSKTAQTAPNCTDLLSAMHGQLTSSACST